MKKLSVLLVPSDLEWSGWRKVLGPVFGTLMMHGSAAALEAWLKTPKARELLADLAARGVEVEYAIHLCSELLPRRLYARRPDMFRVDEYGWRHPDANFCPSSDAAAEVIRKNLRRYAKVFRPTTGRHHIFADDNRPWCRCRKCRKLTDSDQTLLFANILARGLAAIDPHATVAYGAYKPALEVPRNVRPEKNVFVEFAPIERDYTRPLRSGHTDKNRYLAHLAGKLLDYFGTAGSQALDYWLDVSMFSQWMAPIRRIPVSQKVMKADIEYYAELGFENISTIAVWLDRNYVRKFGDAPLRRFAAAAAAK